MDEQRDLLFRCQLAPHPPARPAGMNGGRGARERGGRMAKGPITAWRLRLVCVGLGRMGGDCTCPRKRLRTCSCPDPPVARTHGSFTLKHCPAGASGCSSPPRDPCNPTKPRLLPWTRQDLALRSPTCDLRHPLCTRYSAAAHPAHHHAQRCQRTCSQRARCGLAAPAPPHVQASPP